MRLTLIIMIFSLFVVGCASTSKKESKSEILARQVNQQAMLPVLKEKGLENYVVLYGLSSCSRLLEVASGMGITPKSIEKRKVVIVAHTGEELSFQYPKSCPGA